MQWGFYEPSIPADTTLAATKRLDAAIGRKSDIIHWFVQWGSPTNGSFAANKPWLLAAGSYAIPLITWEAWGPAFTKTSAEYPVTDIAAGKFDAYIDSWATGLAAYGGPVYLRPLHEADLPDYPWGLGLNTAPQIVNAYRHIHDRFALAKATNVKFVWGVNVWSSFGTVQEALYPGDAYCDWMGIDIYNWAAQYGNTWSSLAAGFDVTNIYNRLATLSPKPMMIPEFASVEPSGAEVGVFTKGQWIKDAIAAFATRYPRIQAATWFSVTGTTWALDSSADSLAGAKAALAVVVPPPPPPPPKLTLTLPDGTVWNVGLIKA